MPEALEPGTTRIRQMSSHSVTPGCRSVGRGGGGSRSFVALALLVISLASVWSPTGAQETGRQWYRFGGTMDLSPISAEDTLSQAAIQTWQDLTSDFYVQALLSRTDLDPPISDPQVTISLLFGSRPADDSTGSVLAIQYQATASFISESTSYDPGILALPAFREQTAVLQYVITLRQSGQSIFADVMSLSLTVQTANPIPAPTPPPVQPTLKPTLSPTRAPTSAPVVPTPFPTRAPFTRLTPFPTPGPTGLSTSTPWPTPSPTPAPVVPASTPQPTVLQPTFSLTAAPADGTPSPTEPMETPYPTPGDVATAPGFEIKYATTQLILKLLPGEMEGDVLENWKQVTASYLISYIQALDPSLLQKPLQGETVPLKVEKVLQEQLDDEGRRQLEDQADVEVVLPEDSSANVTTLTAVSVEFISKLELPSSSDEYSLVNGAFATRARREAYRKWILSELQGMLSQGETTADTVLFFESLEEIVYVDDAPNGGPDDDKVDPSVKPQTDEPPPTGLIIGGVVGGLTVILIFVACIYRMPGKNPKDMTSSDGGNGSGAGGTNREMSPNSNGNRTQPTQSNPSGLTWEPAEQPSRLNQEILVQDSNMDDVSTIGDPFLYGQPPGIQEDERTATTSVVQSDTYNSLLGRQRLQHENSFARSQGDATEFSAFTGMSKYLMTPNNNAAARRGILGELGLGSSDDTSFEQRLFPMDDDPLLERSVENSEERSLDYSLPTALMKDTL